SLHDALPIFFTSMELGIEKPPPFTGAAVVVLFAPGGLLAPAEGIPVPFVARVRGSTPFRVVVGRVSVPVEAASAQTGTNLIHWPELRPVRHIINSTSKPCLHESRILAPLHGVSLAGPVQPVEVALPVIVRLCETLNRFQALAHAILLIRSWSSGSSSAMTAVSCRCTSR